MALSRERGETRRAERADRALAAEKTAAADARRAAEEQSRRAIEAEGKAERERLVAEAAKREAALQAQLQSAEAARRRAEVERKQLDDQRQRAEDEKRAAEARAVEEKRAAAARAEEVRKKRAGAVAASAVGAQNAVAGTSRSIAGGSRQFDRAYEGLLCNVPNDPSKRACWRVPLKVENGAAIGSWPNRLIGKTAYAQVTVDQGGAVKLVIDGWNVNQGTPLTGTMTGRAADNRIDADGRWANGARVEGHWTRAP